MGFFPATRPSRRLGEIEFRSLSIERPGDKRFGPGPGRDFAPVTGFDYRPASTQQTVGDELLHR